MAIGETILGAVLQVVLEKLASQQVIDFLRSSKLDASLVEKLKTLMSASEKLLTDAEQKQITDRAVKSWLSDLRHLFYRAEEIVDEIATEASNSSLHLPPKSESFGSKVWNLFPAINNSSSFKRSVFASMKEVVSCLEHTLSLKDALGLREIFVDNVTERVPSTSLVVDTRVYGREREKEQLIEVLQAERTERCSISVVAIVGMGGLGKTTLAKLVYNDSELESLFDVKAWVCVSDQFSISRVTKSILESITCQSYSGSLDLNVLQIELSCKLRGKRFLLVLDDVWTENYEDWECLKAPFTLGAHSSRVIVTTRNKEVASIMCTAPVFHLEPLSDEDGWSLFSRHAFEVGNRRDDSSLQRIGREIVHKCRGLPLAIKTLGGLLRLKQGITEWEAILQNNIWDIPENKSNIVPALKLSYYHLPSHLKQCFSYCAIFPKDYEIDRTKLVLLWMAENLIHPTSNKRRIEDIGNEYLNQLLSRSFFELKGKSCIVMHDLMHDLAKAVMGEFCASFEHDDPQKVSKRVRHLSYVRGCFDGIGKFEAFYGSKFLRTFLPVPLEGELLECHVSSKILIKLMPLFCNLRVLSLSKYINLTLLPTSIENLKQLRYLDVSRTKIRKLPETVSTLLNLQTLLLSHCICLVRLPEETWKLVSLRHLDISRTDSLIEMPEKMSSLTNLQMLTDFVVGNNSGSGIREMKKLCHIRGRFVLRQLQNITAPLDALEANLSNRNHLDELAFEFDAKNNNDSEKGRAVLENLKPHTNVKRLTIRNYVGTSFPSWLSTHLQEFENIRVLVLAGCLYCYSLPPLGQLPYLKVLEVAGMDYIKVVGPEFYGRNSILSNPFPSVERLTFKEMTNWEVWSTYGVEDGFPFACLQVLHLNDCPKLKGNLPAHLPSLRILDIRGCEQLEVSTCCQVALRSMLSYASITLLRLNGLVNLVNLPPELVRLSSLKKFDLLDCKSLKSLAYMQLPPKLEYLYIWRCKILESLPEFGVLSSLQTLSICGCPCLKWDPVDVLPTSLQSLVLDACKSLEFPIQIDSMHQYTSLKRLKIKGINDRFISFPLGVFPNLRSLQLLFCDELEKIYIPDGIGSNSLSLLHKMEIVNCSKLDLLGVSTTGGVLLPIPNLLSLEIISCNTVCPLLGNGEGLPSKLVSLSVNLFDKVTHHWSARNYARFTCLRELWIRHHSVERFPDNDSLPVSLDKLYIGNFGKLKYLNGKALIILTSLQELWIQNCPKLQSLPEEGLPPSLGCLKVNRCSLLEDRCQRDKGQDWFKIQHLPCIKINGVLI